MKLNGFGQFWVVTVLSALLAISVSAAVTHPTCAKATVSAPKYTLKLPSNPKVEKFNFAWGECFPSGDPPVLTCTDHYCIDDPNDPNFGQDCP